MVKPATVFHRPSTKAKPKISPGEMSERRWKVNLICMYVQLSVHALVVHNPQLCQLVQGIMHKPYICIVVHMIHRHRLAFQGLCCVFAHNAITWLARRTFDIFKSFFSCFGLLPPARPLLSHSFPSDGFFCLQRTLSSLWL